ncbi:g4392 [Coccomyxa viridis]|uniref:G4392 protein n=1 Tax=Coccomyxa viridis TaxID=1274662 RepID=A0ABP1FQ66_9CHLO
MGNPIAWEAWARQGRLRLQHLRDIILSGTTQTQPALQQEVTLLLDSMPASWAAHVCGPAPQPTHLVSAAAGDSRVFCPDAEGQLIHTYTTRFRHSLSLSHSWPSGLTSLVPGQLASSTPDLGSEPAHEYVVRTRASRLRTLRRTIAGLPDAVSSMRPAIWPPEYGDEHSGIRRLESRWAAAWDHSQQVQPQTGQV